MHRHAKFPQVTIEKSPCHCQTPPLCWICRSNHELNRQLRGRAINCNVTDGFRAQVSSQVKLMQAYKEIIQSIGIDVVVFVH